MDFPYLSSAVKFAILATFGELLGRRISKKTWQVEGFGLASKAILWFFFGMVVKAAFVLFSAGMPALISSMGFAASGLLAAFAISLGLNGVFGPVFMTFHKITDMHIASHKGSLKALIHPLDIKKALKEIDWEVQYGFIIKKTIPFFWIPAHTLVFMLPQLYQMLCAALLGVVLGVILSLR